MLGAHGKSFSSSKGDDSRAGTPCAECVRLSRTSSLCSVLKASKVEEEILLPDVGDLQRLIHLVRKNRELDRYLFYGKPTHKL